MKATLKTCGKAIALGALFASAETLAEDGYVESLGKQFVNLRAYKTPNTRVWIDFQTTYEFDGGYHYLLGTDGDKTGSHLGFYVDGNGHFYFKVGDAGKPQWQKALAYDTQRHTMDLALNVGGAGKHRAIVTTGATTNLDTLVSVASTVTTTNCPMMLFGNGWDYSNGEYANAPIQMKVYGVKIWEGAELIHDYVPRKIDGTYGFRDLVDGQFVTGVTRSDGNPVTERLTGGGDIVEEAGDAYIRSHNREQVDLGLKADAATRVELDHQLVDINDESYLFGARATDGTSLTFWGFYASKGGQLGAACRNGEPSWGSEVYFATSAKTGIVPAEERRTLIIDALNDKISCLNAGYECFTKEITTAHTGETQATIGLFGSKFGTSWGGKVAMKFYGMNIYKNGELVQAFKPYIQSARPGILGLDGVFRTANDYFSMTNQPFEVGGAITGDAGMDDLYLETTGNEQIDSEWVPTAQTKVVVDFALTDPSAKNGGHLFGVRDSGSGPYFWVGMDGWRLAAATANSSWQFIAGTGVLNMGRYELTMDASAGEATLKQGGATVATKTLVAANPLPTTSMAIMGMRIEGARLTSGSKIRLYSLKIYDDGQLVRSYYPDKNSANGDVGLYDSCRARFNAPTQSYGVKLRGRTVDGVSKGFSQTPPAKVTLGQDETVTLTASAPYATSYVWRRNGVVIAGETGASYTVPAGGRGIIVYSVAPVYTVNRFVGAADQEVEGDAATTEVVYQRGLSIFVR